MFPETKDVTRLEGEDGRYRTIFGPAFAHTGVIFGVSNRNQRLALRRMTAARGSLALDKTYRFLQRNYVTVAAPFLDGVSRHLAAHLPQYTDYLDEGIAHYADPHPKKALRVQAWDELLHGGFHGHILPDRLWIKRVKYKMKADEFAKPGKFPRMIGDLGVAASLQRFRLVDMLKTAMAAAPLEYGGGHMSFCKSPEPRVLLDHFRKLLDPPGRFYFVYFSDDSCLAIRKNGQVYVYNLDISSCDASHDDGVFDALLSVVPVPYRKEFEVLIEQCKLPIVIRDVDDPRSRRRVILKPTGPRLYSGSTITTFINNMANVLICKSIVDDNACLPVQIAKAAAKVGYIVSVAPCTQPQDIQFLKHSPVYDTDGNMRAMLNLGVLLRAIGACKGDLPGRGDLRQRAEMFTHAVVQGMYPRTQFSIRDSLIHNSRPPTAKVIAFARENYGHHFHSDDNYAVDDVQLFKRYRVKESDFIPFVALVSTMGFEDHLASPAADSVLALDYGLNTKHL